MIKGCQKKIIMINDTGSDVFEQAYFIVKDERNGAISKTDMIREANRIIENNLLGPYFSSARTKKIKKKTETLTFFLGSVCGGGFVALFWAIVAGL